MIVAIDGPSGAGKSTLAKHIAKELGFTYLDTGAIYRALALKILRRGVDLDDTAALNATLIFAGEMVSFRSFSMGRMCRLRFELQK
jgi:cytidylate kinase